MELLTIERQRADVPVRRADVAREITALETEQGELEAARERARLERRHHEGEIETLQTKLRRYEEQLGAVKTNVAYSALLTEIQGAKRAIGELEDAILRLMELRDGHDRRLAEIGGELEERRAAAAEALDALAVEERALGAALAAGQVRRDDLLPGVDKGWHRLYDRLRRGRRFPALVPLRGRACGACHAHLPPQVVREVTHDRTLHPCESCGVLIYAELAPVAPADSPAAPNR
ncbi:MAG: zinc ribbon domain-containing protein, partial [Gemmatimonadota bacterium]